MAKHGPSSPPPPPPISPPSSSRSSSRYTSCNNHSPTSVVTVLVTRATTTTTPTADFVPMEKHARHFASDANEPRYRKRPNRKRSIPGNANNNYGDNGSATSNTTLKSVHFHHRIKARAHISRWDMTVQEHRSCWFQEDEYRGIERRNERAIVRIERALEGNNYGHVGNSNNHHHQVGCCPRGLENGLRSEYVASEAYRLASKDEVFLEQDKQYRKGIYDDKAIAKAYKKITRKCRFRAHTKAVLDHKEVEDDCYSTVELTDDDENNSDEYDAPFGTTTSSSRHHKKERSKPFAAVRLWVSKHGRKTTSAA